MSDLLIIGNYLPNVKCETFIDPETGRKRVRPLPGQGIPTSLVIECSRSIRDNYPLGTKFLAVTLKVCDKSNGRMYLRAEGQMIFKIEE